MRAKVCAKTGLLRCLAAGLQVPGSLTFPLCLCRAAAEWLGEAVLPKGGVFRALPQPVVFWTVKPQGSCVALVLPHRLSEGAQEAEVMGSCRFRLHGEAGRGRLRLIRVFSYMIHRAGWPSVVLYKMPDALSISIAVFRRVARGVLAIENDDVSKTEKA